MRVSQKMEDVRKLVAVFRNQLIGLAVGRSRQKGMIAQLHQFLRDAGGGQDDVYRSAGDGGMRHSGMLGGFRVLREGCAEIALDRAQALNAIGPAAREDNSDGAVALIGSQ